MLLFTKFLLNVLFIYPKFLFRLKASSLSLLNIFNQIKLGFINPDYAYPSYGVPSEETNDAIRLAAKTEGMITDPVYEGKSMQGLIDLAKKQFFPEGSRILYAHLGGAPALNGYSYYYKDG